jgi:hypothetical protein
VRKGRRGRPEAAGLSASWTLAALDPGWAATLPSWCPDGLRKSRRASRRAHPPRRDFGGFVLGRVLGLC